MADPSLGLGQGIRGLQSLWHRFARQGPSVFQQYLGGVWVGSAVAAPPTEQIVRIAQLVIDPSQLAAYQVAVKEEMADSVRLEPGVLTLYSVQEKEHSNRLHFFEICSDEAAYQSHIASQHFQKYVKTTQSMILSKQLIETEPVQRRVIIEFESIEQAQAWYNSASYTELKKIRQRSANTDVYLIEGVPGY